VFQSSLLLLKPSLAVQRLRTTQEKKESLTKSSRREIATLIEKGKLEKAKIRVEGLISDEIYLELLELMELYCELLLARFGLVENR
jgi:vacuolar protein sorting-associated protein IST1